MRNDVRITNCIGEKRTICTNHIICGRAKKKKKEKTNKQTYKSKSHVHLSRYFALVSWPTTIRPCIVVYGVITHYHLYMVCNLSLVCWYNKFHHSLCIYTTATHCKCIDLWSAHRRCWRDLLKIDRNSKQYCCMHIGMM